MYDDDDAVVVTITNDNDQYYSNSCSNSKSSSSGCGLIPPPPPPRFTRSTRSTLHCHTVHQTRCALTTATFAETPHSTQTCRTIAEVKPVISPQHRGLKQILRGPDSCGGASPLSLSTHRTLRFGKILDMNYDHFPH